MTVNYTYVMDFIFALCFHPIPVEALFVFCGYRHRCSDSSREQLTSSPFRHTIRE